MLARINGAVTPLPGLARGSRAAIDAPGARPPAVLTAGVQCGMRGAMPASEGNTPKIHHADSRALPVVLALNGILPPAQKHSGRRRALRELFNNRVTWRGVQHWMAGRRKPPQWARDTIIAAHEAKARHHQHLASLLKEKAPN
jgi:hypothetical protein